MLIKKLPWDTKFFGFQMANLSFKKVTDLINLDEVARKEGIKFLQCCVPVKDLKKINVLEKKGFNFADLKISYVLDLKQTKFLNAKEVVLASAKDFLCLKKIAREVFKESRFYHPKFKRSKANQLYELWLEKAIKGTFDDFCLKIKDNKKKSVGFITAKSISSKEARIGLIGVAKNCQGQGYGKKILSTLNRYYQERGYLSLEVATQGKNLNANNFYLRNGFLIKSVESWYYKFY